MKVPRLYLIGIVLTLVGAVIFFQMGRLQISASGRDLKDKADNLYRYRYEKIYPERGRIFDRFGNLIAGNKVVYEVGINLNEVENSETIAADASEILELDKSDIKANASMDYVQGKAEYVRLTDFVSADKIDQLVAAKEKYRLQAEEASTKKKRWNEDPEVLPSLEGLVWLPHLQRVYPEGKLAANILGFYAFADRNQGSAHYGIEEQYDPILAGIPLDVKIPVEPRKIQNIPSVPPGADVILTIDRKIQGEVEKIIDRGVEKNKADSGTIVVMDPKTGEIIAMAVSPRIDPNRYWDTAEEIAKNKSYNRAIDITYEPGSVFKVITMAAALDSGTVTPDTPFLDTGVFNYGGIEVLNWDWGAWGQQTMLGCMQHSLNVCLSWVAVQLGPNIFYDYLRRFEIGRRTNIDLAGEKIWPLATPSDSYWSDSNLVTNSFGQGLAVSPIALTRAIAAVANDGQMMEPHIVKSIISNGLEEVVHPRLVGNPITPQTSRTLTELLATSLLEESSVALVDGYRLAGKTGTAEIATQYGYTESLTNASFVGWGPADDPRFIVFVWLEKPRSDRWGSTVAAPIFSEVVSQLVFYMDIPNDQKRQQLVMNP